MVVITELGDKLVVPAEDNEPSVIEGESEVLSRTRWYSAAIIHYTGDGLWRVGLVPHAHSKWEWFTGLTSKEAGLLLAETKFRLCPTDELEERLGQK